MAISETQSLGELLPQEIVRNEELLTMYASLPPQSGWFGVAMIKEDLASAHKATMQGDVVAMLQAYERLKGNK
jgi:hypothetical protein